MRVRTRLDCKTHLMSDVHHAWCNEFHPYNWTDDPELVTCKLCRRAIDEKAIVEERRRNVIPFRQVS